MPLTSPSMRVLVLGGTGMLGHAAVDILGETFDVCASVRDLVAARAFGLNAELVEFDARRDDPRALLDRVRPDAVLNAIGLVKQLPEGQSPQAAIRLNALLPHELADACAAAGARLIHVSTDCVFSGELPAPARYTRGRHARRARPVRPQQAARRGARPGRAHASARRSSAASSSARAGLLEWFAAQGGKPVRGFTEALVLRPHDARARRASSSDPASSTRSSRGLCHVAAEPIDKYDLLVALRDVLGIELRDRAASTSRASTARSTRRASHAATGYRAPVLGRRCSTSIAERIAMSRTCSRARASSSPAAPARSARRSCAGCCAATSGARRGSSSSRATRPSSTR